MLLKLKWFKSEEGTLGVFSFVHKKSLPSYGNGKDFFWATYYPIHKHF